MTIVPGGSFYFGLAYELVTGATECSGRRCRCGVGSVGRSADSTSTSPLIRERGNILIREGGGRKRSVGGRLQSNVPVCLLRRNCVDACWLEKVGTLNLCCSRFIVVAANLRQRPWSYQPPRLLGRTRRLHVLRKSRPNKLGSPTASTNANSRLVSQEGFKDIGAEPPWIYEMCAKLDIRNLLRSALCFCCSLASRLSVLPVSAHRVA